MARVDLINVEKAYGRVKVVHGIDLSVADGEFMVLVGPSGCAKSTTLRMIAGLESITAGEIRIGGKVVNNVAPGERGIAMVFQNYALYPHMKVSKNLSFGLRIRGKKKAEIDPAVDATAKILEIEEYLQRLPKQLSGGQAQRVAVGRALIKKPEVFLFDEPLSNLDAKLRAAMRVRITGLHRDLKASGNPATVIYVTHDQTEAMTMGDRICVMKDGVIQQVDGPETLYRWPVNTFVAGFIGTPEMNLLPAALSAADGGMLRIGDVTVPLGGELAGRTDLAREGAAIFGVRPQQIRIAGPTEPGAVPARVRFVEYMGHDVTVHLTVGGLPATALVPADRYAPSAFDGDLAHLTFDMARSHVFDAGSGLNVSLPVEVRRAA